MKTITIPADPRDGRPLITNAMKADCIGEFSFEEERTCYSCHEIERCDECEVCGGEVNYTQKLDVPWDTCKEIYKRMALVAAKEAADTPNSLTCVYCGMAYPEGTPPHGTRVLTDHIKVCEKHPLRAAEATIQKLRSALVGLVGASEKAELDQMEEVIRIADAPAKDKAVAIDAIHALLEFV